MGGWVGGFVGGWIDRPKTFLLFSIFYTHTHTNLKIVKNRTIHGICLLLF